MHPELIKARLRMAGYTLADVARETQTDPSTVRFRITTYGCTSTALPLPSPR